MTALEPGPAPSPAQAQCSVCMQTFSGPRAFDRHRVRGVCLDPAERGMHRDARGVWRAERTVRPPHWAADRLSGATGGAVRVEPENADLGPLSGLADGIFVADFEDECAACGEPIVPGEDVRGTRSGFIHADDGCEQLSRLSREA